MKKLSAAVSFGLYFLNATLIFAQQQGTSPQGPNIIIDAPSRGYSNLGAFITAAINFIFIIAAVSVLVMLVWGALQWIFSGGEKDAVASARNRILNALIGLAILAVAFAIAVVFGRFVGINLFNLPIPGPTNVNPAQPAIP